VVVRPESTEDVAKIVKIAVKYKMPVTPYSGGSSLEGNFRAVRVTLPVLVPRAESYFAALGRWDMHRYVRDGQDSRDSRLALEMSPAHLG